MLLVVNKDKPSDFEKIDSGNFGSLNIWERSHIQEWIRKVPEILGEDLLIVSIEFDKFTNSSDRLDVLAIDTKGNLVVIELKRDGFAGYADLQAIRYAAMVSSMTLAKLIPYYISYQKKYTSTLEVDADKVMEEIKEFVADSVGFEELSNRPRIILCSEDFSQELTTTVLWLNQCGLDITCVRIKPHLVENKIIVIPTIIIPIQEAKQYLIEVQEKEEAKQHVRNRVKRPTTIRMLLNNDCVKSGDRIFLKDYLPDFFPTEIDPNYITAEITGKMGKADSVRWLHDGQEYSISNLTHVIFQQLHPEKAHPGALAGGLYWRTEHGKNLYKWADEVWKKNE
ncbi:hypothetical protein [Dyadobacter tibetensis]|uniref:hypothetical protein n=1 Tax=Dyadobacter tibetensis TaxID=1211851 RepID=UPI000472AF54|nr:hypothetical protein [Dyadobacter tibetensis]